MTGLLNDVTKIVSAVSPVVGMSNRTMDPENSRRSACDRCRSQKLRCVRPPKRPNAADDQPLQPCERCTKANAECFSTLPPPRKLSRTERRPSSTHVLSQKSPLRRSLAANDNTQYQGGGSRTDPSPSNGNGSITVNGLPSSNPSPLHQQRSNSQTPFFRQVPKGGFEKTDIGQSGIQRFTNNVPDNRHERSSIAMQPLGTGSMETPNFGMERSPVSDHIRMDNFDFGMEQGPQAGAPHHDDTSTWMDMLLTPGQDTGPASRQSAPVEKAVNQSVGSKEDGLHRLSELSSRLLKDFSRINSMKLPDLLSFAPGGDEAGLYGPGGPGTMADQKNAIGRMLDNSQIFLNTLQYLMPSVPQGTESECSYSDYCDENEFVSTAHDHSYSKRMTIDSTSSATHSWLTDTKLSSTNSLPSPVDTPTTLTIFTCYAWLLQTYDKVFSLIHLALLSDAHLSPHSLPRILPGLLVGGFCLDDQQSLQIEILIHLSTQMLERIEEALSMNMTAQTELSRDHSPNGRDLLDKDSASAILGVMFEQKLVGNAGGEQRRGAATVKQTMERIRRILRGMP